MNQTRRITEGAMMSAIIGTMLYLNRQSAGIFDYALFWIVPTPIIVYIAKYSIKDAMLPIITTMVLSLLISLPQGIYYTAISMAMGLWYGHGIKRNHPNHQLLLSSVMVGVASNLFTGLVFAAFFGFDLSTDIAELQQIMTTGLRFFHMEYLTGYLVPLLPTLAIAGLVLSGMMEGLLIHMINTIVLRRLQLVPKTMISLFDLRLSKSMSMVGLLTIALCIGLQPSLGNGILSNLLIFIFIGIAIVFLVNGYLSFLTILAYYNKRKYILLIVPLFPLLPILGIVDGIYQIRIVATIGRTKR